MTTLEELFTPDYDPIEMFDKGIFEGNYFNKKIGLPSLNRLGFPSNALTALKKLGYRKLSNPSPSDYNNFYKASAGTSYEIWTDNSWINEEDPYGWVNWYIHYYYGRRSKDDKRQITRWSAFKLRHKGMLRKYPNSNKIKQSLLQWGIKSE
jgi:hypothetical protein